MKKFITTLMAVVAIVITACTSNAQTSKVYGNIGYEGAKLLATASAKGKVVGKLQYGDIVEYSAAPNAKYIKVRNIATGKEGYVIATRINEAQYPLEAPELEQAENTEPFLLNIETQTGGESTEGWSFWKDGNSVKAFQMIRLVYNNGRSSTVQHTYKGVAKPGYLLLTEEVLDDEHKGEKLKTPIIIYEDIASRAGVFVNGKCFTPNGQVGGFDTDGWE